MATWTTLPDATLEPGKPIRSIDVLALRDNPVAISEGASGAPKVRTAALQPPTAGNTHIHKPLKQPESDLLPIEKVPFGALINYDNEGNIFHVADVVQCLVPGVIRFAWEMTRATILPPSVSFAKNGFLIQTTTGPNDSTWRNYMFDVTVGTGDTITMYNRVGLIRSAFVLSATPDMAVV